MNDIESFESKMGGRWIGVSFHKQPLSDIRMAKQSMHFCEAVLASSTGAFTLTKTFLNCPGAQRSFGWHQNGDTAFVEKLTKRNGLEEKSAKILLEKTPLIENEEIDALTIGTYDAPDILISYLQPENAMRFVQHWQKVHHGNLDLSISSMMAVCGSVAVGAYKTGRVCCSFGCPESRYHGGIGRDRLVIGVPTALFKDLF